MADGDVEFELTQREFMRLRNLYNKGLKENGLTTEDYEFDMFVCDVFSVMLKKVTYADVKHLLRQ